MSVLVFLSVCYTLFALGCAAFLRKSNELSKEVGLKPEFGVYQMLAISLIWPTFLILCLLDAVTSATVYFNEVD